VDTGNRKERKRQKQVRKSQAILDRNRAFRDILAQVSESLQDSRLANRQFSIKGQCNTTLQFDHGVWFVVSEDTAVIFDTWRMPVSDNRVLPYLANIKAKNVEAKVNQIASMNGFEPFPIPCKL
jgi:adenylosuccinate synthase